MPFLIPVASLDCVWRYEDCCQVYVLRKDDRALLIDLGSGQVLDHLDEIGVREVAGVYFTHAHRDQCQGAERAAARGIPLHFPAGAASFLDPAQRPDFTQPTPFLCSYLGKFDYPRPFTGWTADVQPGTTISWEGFLLEVVPTPGHLDHQVAYLVEVGPHRLAFCGDAFHSAGKVHEAYHWETDHYTGAGARQGAESLRVLQQLRPSVLCPAHGPVTDRNVWEALAATRANLTALAELKDTLCPGRPHVPRLVEPIPNRLMRITEHLFIWNNSYFLTSRDGPVLMVDNAGPLPDDFWQQFRQQIGERPIEVVLISHIHCDHVEGVEALRAQMPSLQCWVQEALVEAIEHPHRFRRPWLPAAGTRVDRALHHGETATWHEYTFRAYHTPGQTDLHATYETHVDGHHVLFSGDSFYPPQQWGGTGGLCGFNGGHPLRGWRPTIELIMQLEPEWLLASHLQPFPYRQADWEAMLRWTEEVAAAMRAVAPDGSLERHHDPHLITLWPYVQAASAGEPLTLTARVQNPYPHPIPVELRLVLPKGLAADGKTVQLTVPPGETGQAAWELALPAGVQGVQMVTLDVTYDEQYLGEKAEAYLRTGA